MQQYKLLYHIRVGRIKIHLPDISERLTGYKILFRVNLSVLLRIEK